LSGHILMTCMIDKKNTTKTNMNTTPKTSS